jgi:hypothetical protein
MAHLMFGCLLERPDSASWFEAARIVDYLYTLLVFDYTFYLTTISQKPCNSLRILVAGLVHLHNKCAQYDTDQIV